MALSVQAAFSDHLHRDPRQDARFFQGLGQDRFFDDRDNTRSPLRDQATLNTAASPVPLWTADANVVYLRPWLTRLSSSTRATSMAKKRKRSSQTPRQPQRSRAGTGRRKRRIGTPSLIFLGLILLMVGLAAAVSLFRGDVPACPPGQVWSSAHGHCH